MSLYILCVSSRNILNKHVKSKQRDRQLWVGQIAPDFAQYWQLITLQLLPNAIYGLSCVLITLWSFCPVTQSSLIDDSETHRFPHAEALSWKGFVSQPSEMTDITVPWE